MMAEITDIPPERIRTELGQLQDLLSSGGRRGEYRLAGVSDEKQRL
jgi:hypothetical protein